MKPISSRCAASITRGLGVPAFSASTDPRPSRLSWQKNCRYCSSKSSHRAFTARRAETIGKRLQEFHISRHVATILIDLRWADRSSEK